MVKKKKPDTGRNSEKNKIYASGSNKSRDKEGPINVPETSATNPSMEIPQSTTGKKRTNFRIDFVLIYL